LILLCIIGLLGFIVFIFKRLVFRLVFFELFGRRLLIFAAIIGPPATVLGFCSLSRVCGHGSQVLHAWMAFACGGLLHLDDCVALSISGSRLTLGSLVAGSVGVEVVLWLLCVLRRGISHFSINLLVPLFSHLLEFNLPLLLRLLSVAELVIVQTEGQHEVKTYRNLTHLLKGKALYQLRHVDLLLVASLWHTQLSL
jgi:hypothetical protein